MREKIAGLDCSLYDSRGSDAKCCKTELISAIEQSGSVLENTNNQNNDSLELGRRLTCFGQFS